MFVRVSSRIALMFARMSSRIALIWTKLTVRDARTAIVGNPIAI
jgi:hypothetical protein